LEASSSHVPSQAPSQSFDFSASSELDPANWDPNYRYGILKLILVNLYKR
jgi:dual specificity protein kinase YAK1